ncbi:MAG: selenocysteine-specific translation elongation factor [Pseudomonadota bacterium]
MIIATAGHVDHGKTSLIKALTGTETDKLPEEKRRGLTIDLGFAYHELCAGRRTGFIDVPGHERFVRTMVAGVSGIDFALLIVAADDGPMPQTLEHLSILNLFGVPAGAVVITKIDKADDARVSEVEDQIRGHLADTALASVPMFPVAALEPRGVDELREYLVDRESEHEARTTEGNFRLAVDRSFLLSGAGRVATGTVFSGQIKLDDSVLLAPLGAKLRVRGIHADNVEAQSARAGQRCALNLTGPALNRHEISRGEWLVHELADFTTQRLGVRLQVLPGEARPLRNRTPFHLHVGTTDVTARLALYQGREIEPGGAADAELLLDHPICAVRGDRFVIRDQSAQRTIGGGWLIDPLIGSRAKTRAPRAAALGAMKATDANDALSALTETLPDGVEAESFYQAWNLARDARSQLASANVVEKTIKDEAFFFSKSRWQSMRNNTHAAVVKAHGARNGAPGVTVTESRQGLAEKIPMRTYQAVVEELLREQRLIREGNLLRDAALAVERSPEEQKLWEKIEKVLKRSGAKAPVVRDLADEVRTDFKRLQKFIQSASKAGQLVRVSDKRCFLPATLQGMADIAESLADSGELTVAKFRDGTGIGRNAAVEILEFFDKIGFTIRQGQIRKVRKPAAEALGAARN